MSVDELRISIERHLDQVSDETERLRAVLVALGPEDTSAAAIGEVSRSRGSRSRRVAPRAETQHTVREGLGHEHDKLSGNDRLRYTLPRGR